MKYLRVNRVSLGLATVDRIGCGSRRLRIYRSYWRLCWLSRAFRWVICWCAIACVVGLACWANPLEVSLNCSIPASFHRSLRRTFQLSQYRIGRVVLCFLWIFACSHLRQARLVSSILRGSLSLRLWLSDVISADLLVVFLSSMILLKLRMSMGCWCCCISWIMALFYSQMKGSNP